MKSTIRDFFQTETYKIDRGYTVHISKAPEFATEAVVEDADGKMELVDVGEAMWEDLEGFVDLVVKAYEKPAPEPEPEPKEKSSYYIERVTAKEMRVEAAKKGLSYPSEFILMLWEAYKKENES